MQLITIRLILKPFTPEDEAEALRLFMDPEFMTDPIEPELTFAAAKTRPHAGSWKSLGCTTCMTWTSKGSRGCYTACRAAPDNACLQLLG